MEIPLTAAGELMQVVTSLHSIKKVSMVIDVPKRQNTPEPDGLSQFSYKRGEKFLKPS